MRAENEPEVVSESIKLHIATVTVVAPRDTYDSIWEEEILVEIRGNIFKVYEMVDLKGEEVYIPWELGDRYERDRFDFQKWHRNLSSSDNIKPSEIDTYEVSLPPKHIDALYEGLMRGRLIFDPYEIFEPDHVKNQWTDRDTLLITFATGGIACTGLILKLAFGL